MSEEERLKQLQISANYETMKHKHLVQRNLGVVIKQLIDRGDAHDNSKMVEPELQYFAQETANLHGLTYDSPKYTANLDKIRPALNHHYANNRHHPQHFKNQVNDMNIVDVIEMFCDWAASCKRHADGNLHTSIEKNAVKYKLSTQLQQIFENSVGLLE